MKKHRNMNRSDLLCPVCSNKFPIPRISGQAREKGHIKTVWCPFCKEERNMTEIRDIDFM